MIEFRDKIFVIGLFILFVEVVFDDYWGFGFDKKGIMYIEMKVWLGKNIMG